MCIHKFPLNLTLTEVAISVYKLLKRSQHIVNSNVSKIQKGSTQKNIIHWCDFQLTIRT